MGRPSKLTPDQWQTIERRLAAGERAAALAREFGVNRSAVSQQVAQRARTIRAMAHKVAEAQAGMAAAQTELAKLPLADQYAALSLAEQLRGISADVAAAAAAGAKTGRRLRCWPVRAAAQLQAGADADDLKAVHALARTGNEAMAPALALLATHRSEAPEPEPQTIVIRRSYLRDDGATDVVETTVTPPR